MNGFFKARSTPVHNNYKHEDVNKVLLEQKKVVHCLSRVLNNLPGSIYWKNRDGVYLGTNNFAREKMKNVNLSQNIVGKTDYDLFPPDIADQYRMHDLEVMAKRCEFSREETVVLPTGKLLIQLSSKRPLLDEEDKVVGVVGNTVDITHIKQVESELRVAKERAEKANRVKTEFMRNMEHDIRTPFNGIWVLAGMLEEQEQDPHKKEYLGDISKAAKELLDYCNDILNTIKKEPADSNTEKQFFNLKTLIESVIVMERVAAKNKNIDLVLTYSEDLPLLIKGDSKSIQRILLNLLSNAIKFTEAGHVKISARLRSKLDNPKIMAQLVIEDTGLGISSDKIAFIFDTFSNDIALNEALEHKNQGLGLPVIKQLIQRIDGEINVFSEIGTGTKFVITFPCEVN